jgi:hypothetical protein
MAINLFSAGLNALSICTGTFLYLFYGFSQFHKNIIENMKFLIMSNGWKISAVAQINS